MSKKENVINQIKAIIKEFGSFTTADLRIESAPVILLTSEFTFVLAEKFDEDTVDAVSYVNEMEISRDKIHYEKLDLSTLEEILLIAKEFESVSEKM